jgi:hypothetical protein
MTRSLTDLLKIKGLLLFIPTLLKELLRISLAPTVLIIKELLLISLAPTLLIINEVLPPAKRNIH